MCADMNRICRTPSAVTSRCKRTIFCNSLLQGVITMAVDGRMESTYQLRVRQDLRSRAGKVCRSRERRKLGNVGELLLEWAFEQLKAAGSTERLLKYKIRPTGRASKQP